MSGTTRGALRGAFGNSYGKHAHHALLGHNPYDAITLPNYIRESLGNYLP